MLASTNDWENSTCLSCHCLVGCRLSDAKVMLGLYNTGADRIFDNGYIGAHRHINAIPVIEMPGDYYEASDIVRRPGRSAVMRCCHLVYNSRCGDAFLAKSCCGRRLMWYKCRPFRETPSIDVASVARAMSAGCRLRPEIGQMLLLYVSCDDFCLAYLVSTVSMT